MSGVSHGSPVVKTSPSNAEGAGSIPGWGAKTTHDMQTKKKKKNRSSIITNSVKNFKNC